MAITNTAGAVKVQYEYDAWGKVLSVTGSMANTLGTQNPMRYRSYYFDVETGYYYLQSRYYDSQWKRFLNADSSSVLAQARTFNEANLFVYCNNEPIRGYDPEGYYNGAKAVDYARLWWYRFNSKYARLDQKGGDCANFASQCIYAGGYKMTDSWHHRRKVTQAGTYSFSYSRAWVKVGALAAYFYGKSERAQVITKKTKLRDFLKKYNIRKGDLLIFKKGSSREHAAIVSVVSSIMIYYTAHSSARFNHPLAKVWENYTSVVVYLLKR